MDSPRSGFQMLPQGDMEIKRGRWEGVVIKDGFVIDEGRFIPDPLPVVISQSQADRIEAKLDLIMKQLGIEWSGVAGQPTR